MEQYFAGNIVTMSYEKSVKYIQNTSPSVMSRFNKRGHPAMIIEFIPKISSPHIKYQYVGRSCRGAAVNESDEEP